jgi:gamma-glutamyltranspeptidase/glutathione hydrolase
MAGSGIVTKLASCLSRALSFRVKFIWYCGFNMTLLRCFCLLILFIHGPASAAENYAVILDGEKGAVATVNPIATQAAANAFAEGGNAIDAALAAAFTLGVVDSHNSGIGGGCFILVRWADGRVQAIDGREMAPAMAHRDMYLRNRGLDKSLSKVGALASGVPGSVGAYYHLQRAGGELSWPDVILPAADIAERGFAIDPTLANRLSRTQDTLRQFPETAAIFLDAEGQPWPVGHRLQQEDLAETYRRLATGGPAYFYGGEFARATEQWMKAHGGLITAKDFAHYQVKIRQPLVSEYQGYTIYGFPTPSSGGIHVAQILNILEHFELTELSTAERYHVIGEAMKLAFADRAFWLGDADFVDVPTAGLISEAYGRRLADKIRMDKALTDVSHGNPVSMEELLKKHTTHIATADAEGNWVAITTTLNTSFGSKVTVPGTGVLLNNQMDDFASQPGVPNAFGLVGAEANSIAPGKRPLSSMSPTIVTDSKGRPVMTVGAAGGPTIITQVLQALVYALAFDKPLEEAVASLRVHHQWKPAELFVEKAMPEEVRQELEEKGHQLRMSGPFGATQAISIQDDQFEAVTEPRLRERNNQ